MISPLKSKIDEFIANEVYEATLSDDNETNYVGAHNMTEGARLLKPLLIKAIKALEFYGMGDYKFGPESIQLNLVKLMEDDGKLSRETLQEINNALGAV